MNEAQAITGLVKLVTQQKRKILIKIKEKIKRKTLNSQNKEGDTILHKIADYRSYKLSKDLSTNPEFENIETLLNSEFSLGNEFYNLLFRLNSEICLDIVKFLIQSGANVNIENKYYQTALEIAESYAQEDLIKELRK